MDSSTVLLIEGLPSLHFIKIRGRHESFLLWAVIFLLIAFCTNSKCPLKGHNIAQQQVTPLKIMGAYLKGAYSLDQAKSIFTHERIRNEVYSQLKTTVFGCSKILCKIQIKGHKI